MEPFYRWDNWVSVSLSISFKVSLLVGIELALKPSLQSPVLCLLPGTYWAPESWLFTTGLYSGEVMAAEESAARSLPNPLRRGGSVESVRVALLAGMPPWALPVICTTNQKSKQRQGSRVFRRHVFKSQQKSNTLYKYLVNNPSSSLEVKDCRWVVMFLLNYPNIITKAVEGRARSRCPFPQLHHHSAERRECYLEAGAQSPCGMFGLVQYGGGNIGCGVRQIWVWIVSESLAIWVTLVSSSNSLDLSFLPCKRGIFNLASSHVGIQWAGTCNCFWLNTGARYIFLPHPFSI